MTSTKFSETEETCDIRRFPLENVWRPKLLMMKTETLETIIYDSLCAAYDHWLETDYRKKPDSGFVLFQLQRALQDEVRAAWKKFKVEKQQT
jgi:hypothetical protein